MEEKKNNQEEITQQKEEYNCSICLNLFVQPITLSQCNHTFCQRCILEIGDNDYKNRCPLCRKNIPTNELDNPKINQSLEQSIIKKFGDSYIAACKDAEKEIKLREQQLKLIILYGNRHQLVQSPSKSKNGKYRNSHKWECFVELKNTSKLGNISNYVKSVKFELHETFAQPIIILTKPPFSVTKTGWGYFQIPITVYWQDWLKLKPLQVTHDLNFSQDIDCKLYSKVSDLTPQQLEIYHKQQEKNKDQQKQQQQQQQQQVIKNKFN